MAALTPLQALVRIHPEKIHYLPFEHEMPTTADAARVLQIAESRIIKTCIIGVGKPKTFVAAILRGVDRIDWKKFESLSSGYKKHSFASAEEALHITGYKTGGTPPIGLGDQLTQIYVDARVFEQDEVYGGGGEKHSLIRIAPHMIQELNHAIVCNISIASNSEKNTEAKEF